MLGRTSLHASPAQQRLARVALGTFYAFTAATLLGYATFGVHPHLLARVPQLAGFYGVAFRFFAIGHVLLGFGVLALLLSLRAGGRWLGAFAALYAISLASELLGTRYGVPFGEYAYTGLLGPKWFGDVPALIPLSWFFMAVPSYALARAAFPVSGHVAARVLAASLLLLAWDLALDPAMSYATPYWIWGDTGPYYGMPWLNLFGWYVTGILLMAALAALRADAWIIRVPLGWMAAFYLANLLLPLGMAAAAGLWGAVAATLGAVGGAGLLLHRLARPDTVGYRIPPRPVSTSTAERP